MTFHDCPGLENEILKFHDFQVFHDLYKPWVRGNKFNPINLFANVSVDTLVHSHPICWPICDLTVKGLLDGNSAYLQHCDMVTSYLAKNGVLPVQLRCRSKSKEELTLIIIRTRISHSNQSSTHKTEPLVKLIL